MSKRLFCFGYGYVAEHLCNHLSQKGWGIFGTKQQALTDHPFLFSYNKTDKLSDEILSSFTHFLISIPPDENGDLVVRDYKEFFAAHVSTIQWVGYLSATNVYGDHKGAWVTENSETVPTSARGRHRLKAEQQWMHLYEMDNLPVRIFRLSGIYGPGRSAIDRIQQGKLPFYPPLINGEEPVFSRCHVDDICQVLEASFTNAKSLGEIFNIADDYPCPSSEVLMYAYECLNQSPPDFFQQVPSQRALEFYADHKRVSNDKIKKILGIRLIHSSYKEALKIMFHQNELL